MYFRSVDRPVEKTHDCETLPLRQRIPSGQPPELADSPRIPRRRWSRCLAPSQRSGSPSTQASTIPRPSSARSFATCVVGHPLTQYVSAQLDAGGAMRCRSTRGCSRSVQRSASAAAGSAVSCMLLLGDTPARHPCRIVRNPLSLSFRLGDIETPCLPDSADCSLGIEAACDECRGYHHRRSTDALAAVDRDGLARAQRIDDLVRELRHCLTRARNIAIGDWEGTKDEPAGRRQG